MMCERCSRSMEYASDAGNWWCPHCHHRVFGSPDADAPAERTPAPSAVPVRAPTAEPASAPVPVARAASAPAARPPSQPETPQPVVRQQVVVQRRALPIVLSVVLSLVAIGMIGAAAVRCGSGGGSGGVDIDLVLSVAPEDAGRVRGMSWASLRRSELGRALLDELASDDFISAATERACNVRMSDVIDWLVRTDRQGKLFGGITVTRLGWTEDQVHDCAVKAAEKEGQDLDIERAGKLRGYRFSGGVDEDPEPFWLAWLDDRTLLITSEWKSAAQRSLLQELLAPDREPPESNKDLERALGRVDSGATFWVAMARPERGDPDPDDLDFGEGRQEIERWFDVELSGMLGSRPDSIYLSLDVGSGMKLAGGAVYKSEHKAERVGKKLEKLIERLRDAGGAVDVPRFDGLDPALRKDLEDRYRKGARGAQGFRAALIEVVEIEVDGDVVEFRAELDAGRIEALGGTSAAPGLLEGINRLLPRDLALRM